MSGKHAAPRARRFHKTPSTTNDRAAAMALVALEGTTDDSASGVVVGGAAAAPDPAAAASHINHLTAQPSLVPRGTYAPRARRGSWRAS